MRIPPRLAEFLADFELISDRSERIDTLIDISDAFEPIPASIAQPPYPEERRVPGCESEVFSWLSADSEKRATLEFAVENPQGLSAKAMAQILISSINGESLDSILVIPEDIVYQIFGQELSMGKSMGLTNMIGQVKAQARQLLEE